MNTHAEMVISVETKSPEAGEPTYVEFHTSTHAEGRELLRGLSEILKSVGFKKEPTRLMVGGKIRPFSKEGVTVEVGDSIFLVPDRVSARR